MNAVETIDAGAAAALTERCLDHLRLEELFRARATAVLRAVQEALNAGRWGALADLTPAQEQLAQESEQMRLAQRRLCDDAAAVLNLPSDGLTLERIGGRLPPPFAERLRRQRAETRARAQETQRLAQLCGVVARYHLDFIQRFFADLTGLADGACYGPEGTLRPSTCRSLLEARG